MATSLIPDGIIDDFKLSKKFTSVEQGIRTTNSGGTYTAFTPTDDSVNNKVVLTNEAVGNVVMITSVVNNQSAIPVSTPKPIEVVDRDLIASNHHSVYAYNGLTYAGSGKVSTGSSVESKSVDTDGYSSIYYDIGETVTVNTGDVVSCINPALILDGEGEGLFERTGSSFSNVTLISAYTISADENYWKRVGYTPEVFIHSTISLDSNSIVGSKALVTQTADATQVFTQEMVYNVDWGDTDEFDALTDTTSTNLNGDTVQHKVLHKASSVKIGE